MKKFKVYFTEILTREYSVIVEAQDEEDAKYIVDIGDYDSDKIVDEGFWVEEPEIKVNKAEEIEDEE